MVRIWAARAQATASAAQATAAIVIHLQVSWWGAVGRRAGHDHLERLGFWPGPEPGRPPGPGDLQSRATQRLEHQRTQI